MIAALPDEEYDVRDIFIDKQGTWHSRGIPMEPARAIGHVDVVLNALHGGIGEDGTVQRLLDRLGIPYTGTRALGAINSLNKRRTAEILRNSGVLMPQTMVVYAEGGMNAAEMARMVFASFGPPYAIKPISEGAGRGFRVADTFLELPDAIADVLDAYRTAIVQQYIPGREATVGIIENFRDQDFYALPPAEVKRPDGARHIHFDLHESGSLAHEVPSSFSQEEKERLEHAARLAHRTLGMSHFSRADFIVHHGKPYLLEMNATPGLYTGAAFPHMLESVGSNVREFLVHAIGLARNNV